MQTWREAVTIQIHVAGVAQCIAVSVGLVGIDYQRDTDADGYGNLCDGDGTINTLDLNIYKGLHRKSPGASCCGVF